MDINTSYEVSSASMPGYTCIELFGRFAAIFLFAKLSWWLFGPLIRHAWWRIVSGPAANDVWRPSATNWAVITGGTDGIGLAYCRELARRGYPLLIISRTEEKLRRVRDELRQTFPACPEIRVVAFDFGQNSNSTAIESNDLMAFDDASNYYSVIERAIADLAPGRVDVLVNNVGMSFTIPEYFTVISERDPRLLSRMININVVSCVRLTRIVWDRMIEDNRGVVLNIGSQSALNPIPLLSVYSATKAFVDDFTCRLRAEATDRPGVIVQSILPGFVSTNMSHLRASRTCPTADTFVRSAIGRVGHAQRTYGYWYHSTLGRFYEALDAVLGSDFNSWLAFTMMKKLRAKYYRVKRKTDTFAADFRAEK